MPPSAMKAGAPITATARTSSAGTNSRVDASGTVSTSTPITLARAAAANRSRHVSDAR